MTIIHLLCSLITGVGVNYPLFTGVLIIHFGYRVFVLTVEQYKNSTSVAVKMSGVISVSLHRGDYTSTQTPNSGIVLGGERPGR